MGAIQVAQAAVGASQSSGGLRNAEVVQTVSQRVGVDGICGGPASSVGRQSAGDEFEDVGAQAQTEVRRPDLHVLHDRVHAIDTGPPGDDPIAFAEDRGDRHSDRHRVPGCHEGFYLVQIVAVSRIMAAGYRILWSTDNRRTERDYPLDEIRAFARAFGIPRS